VLPAARPTCQPNAAQGYRLELSSAAHALLAAAARNEKCQFSGSLSTIPNIFLPKTIPVVRRSYPENLEAIIAAVPELSANK